MGQIPRSGCQSRIQHGLACRRPACPQAQRLHLGFRHRPRHPFRRLRHAAARLQAPQRHFLGQAQFSSQSFLPLLHPRHGTIIWAAKNSKPRHTFHYKLMKEANRGKHMKSVWEIRPPEPWEKKFGKHPTQKPVALLERILLASTNEGDLVLDPFSGSGTTLLAAFRLRRHALGCELSAEFLSLSLRRICSNLVQIALSLSVLEISFSSLDFSVDPLTDPMDRSKCTHSRAVISIP